jgi:peptidoglycan/LPS O-acetylase OafA/YrhL
MVGGAGFVGEVLAGLASMMRLRRRDGVPLRTGLTPVLWVALAVAGALVLLTVTRHWHPCAAVVAGGAAAFAVGIAALLGSPILREEVQQLWSRRRSPGPCAAKPSV